MFSSEHVQSPARTSIIKTTKTRKKSSLQCLHSLSQEKITFSMNNVFERNPFIKSNTPAMAPSTPLIYLVHLVYLAFMSLAFGAGPRACAELLIQLAVSISIVLVVGISTTMLLQTASASASAASISFPALLCLAFTSLVFVAGLCKELLPVMLAVPTSEPRPKAVESLLAC
jgi:hypothetical protein